MPPTRKTLQGMRQANAKASTIKVPLYVHHGDVDTITYEPATRKFVEAATACSDKTYTAIPGGYHEVLLGPEKVTTTEAMADWILERSASRAKL